VLVLFGTADGKPWAHGPWFGEGVVDMALDRAADSLWVVTEDPTGEGTELYSLRFTPPDTDAMRDREEATDVFGMPQSRAWLDGRARVLPVPGGVLLFEEGYGERWRFLAGDGGFAPSVPAWRPASVWARHGVNGTTIHALAYGVLPGLHQMQAWLGAPMLLSPGVAPLGVTPGSWPSSARLQPGRHGGLYLADIHAGQLVLSRVGGSEDVRRQRFAVPAARIEQLLVIDGPAAADGAAWERVVVLLNEPPAVAIVDLRVAATPGLLEHRLRYAPLQASAVVQDRFFGRFMLVRGDWVLVATAAGVEAFDVRKGLEQPLALPRFDGSYLSGPLVLVE
jgi:hypothetical protein